MADSADNTKEYFENYGKKEISFSSNQVDAVIGFFTSRGFEKSSAQKVGNLILEQAKISQTNVFTILEQLKQQDKLKLNKLVTGILNNNRSRVSILGIKEPTQPTIESRNIEI